MPRAGYDLIVVGLGAVGSAALYHAASVGLRVLGIDRHHPPHEFGSSHAESRITRLAVGEGPQYLPFVARSHQIWRELADRTGEQLLYETGGFIVNPGAQSADPRWGSFVARTADIASDAAIAYERPSTAEAMQRWPNVIFEGTEELGFETTGGIVLCERAVATQLDLARSEGAEVLLGQPVTAVEPVGDGVVVTIGADRYEADGAIVATGGWFPELAPAIDAAAVRILRQTVFFFEVDDPGAWSTDVFPFFLWAGHTIEEYSAVFPMAAAGCGALKVLGEQFSIETTAETVNRSVSEAEIDDFYERLVVPRLHGVRREVRQTSVCLYTNTADEHFLIDAHPDSDRVMFASPCSGHGFKHSTALAEAMVQQLANGASERDLSAFARKG